MNKKKKETIILLILCLGNVLLLSMGHFLNNKIVILFSLITFIILLLISPKSKFLAILFFYLPWSPIMKLNSGSYTFYTIAIASFFLLLLFSNELFNKGILTIYNLLLMCTLFVYTMIIKLFLGYNLSFDYLMFLLMLILFPSYLLIYKKKISFEVSVLFFSIGIVTSGFSSILLMEYPHMLEFIAISEWRAVGLKRLSGFYGDANFYSAHILVAIGGLLLLIMRKKFYDVILLFILVYFLIYLGFLSVSKMFLLVLISILILWFITVLIQKGMISTKLSIILTGIAGITFINSYGVLTNSINMYLIRFSMVSDLSSLTTGRSNILGDYYSFFIDNPGALLFGQGITNVYKGIISNAAHNTLIQIIYQFGMVGSVLIIIWIVQLCKLMNPSKKSSSTHSGNYYIYIIILAVVCFVPWLSLDILFADEFFLITTLFLIGKDYLTVKNYEA